MEDSKIVDLYWERSESAITESKIIYGNYCRCIAFRILSNTEDAEECENDTYMRAWNSIPPHRPANLKTFLGKITRNLSLNKYEKFNRYKRGGGQTEVALSELEECLTELIHVEDNVEDEIIAKAISTFLRTLTEVNQIIFIRRYWYFDKVCDIAERCGVSQSNVKTSLHRMRNGLRKFLMKEGVYI